MQVADGALAFELPPAGEAHEPPEARGIARDEVGLLVAARSSQTLTHARFTDLPELLDAGDLLVVNTSGTLPSAVPARRTDGTAVRVHFSTRVPGQGPAWRVVEVRSADGSEPLAGPIGERLSLAGGGLLELVAPYVAGRRLTVALLHGGVNVEHYLQRHGEPIRYGHGHQPFPIEAYQNVYARTAGSAEMPSAGRPLTAAVITRLAAAGILIAPLTLHCGVSSPEAHEPPFPEQYEVPPTTGALVEAVRHWGGRVIAVGTTVVRALETAARPDGSLEPSAGWTNLVIAPERVLRVVDGLITGWHEPEASHLKLLEAAAGRELLSRSYSAALANGYLWHEFGDSHLVLP